MSLSPEAPPPPRRRARRRWLVALVWLGIPVLLISGWFVWGTVQANQQQARLDAAIAQLQIPHDWTLVEVDRRTPGFVGMCFTSVFDVRTCDEASLMYSVPELPAGNDDVSRIAPDAVWSTVYGDCSDRDVKGSDLICARDSVVGAYAVRVLVWANAESGRPSDPRVRVTVGSH